MDLDTTNLQSKIQGALQTSSQDARTKELKRRIDDAFLLPRVKKWQAVIRIYCEEVPGLAEVARAHRKLAKQRREEAGIFNPKVVMKGGEMRLGLTLPAAFLDILNTCDPEFAEIMASNDNPAGQKKMYHQLVKAFREYAVPSDLANG